MYTGFDAETKLADFETGGDPLAIASAILADFQANEPLLRIDLASKELAGLAPDFIALQEVTLFTVSPLFSVDYLTELIKKIKDNGGPDYERISIDNLTLSDTVDLGLLIPATVIYKDREAILYKKEFKIKGEVLMKKLSSHRDGFIYNGQEYVFFRSLLGGRFRYGSDQIISIFSTHLDQVYLEDVQKNQMHEIIDTLSLYMNDENLVLMGDFNSEEGDETYSLLSAAGLIDTFRFANPNDEGLTCCSLADLSNTDPMPYQRIDLIFNKSTKWTPVESTVILNTRDSIWPSDHFGVMTTFEKAQK